jgi:hypothetical protein
LNQLKCGVDPLELDASGICCKAPIRLGLIAIASAQPSLDQPQPAIIPYVNLVSIGAGGDKKSLVDV